MYIGYIQDCKEFKGHKANKDQWGHGDSYQTKGVQDVKDHQVA